MCVIDSSIAYERWMPHINLIFPFVPEAAMQGVLPQLQSAMSKIAPFVVTLHDFCHFNHGNSNTIYLEPKTDVSVKMQFNLQNRDLMH